MKRLMIGLCGGTGSGKTTLARKIYNSLGSENAVLIGMDSYYKANWDIPYEQRIKTNYDHPNAFDTELMVQCFLLLSDIPCRNLLILSKDVAL